MGISIHRRTHRSSPTGAGLMLALIAPLLLGGCGSVKKDKLANELQSATSGYQSALRWGYYENAYAHLRPESRKNKPMPAVLEGLRLTGYDVVQPPSIKGNDTATQIVLIEYLHDDTQVVKKVTDRQLWRWDAAKKTWWLESGLPKFE